MVGTPLIKTFTVIGGVLRYRETLRVTAVIKKKWHFTKNGWIANRYQRCAIPVI